MPPNPANLRDQKYCEVAYLIAIDGIPIMWCTDHLPGSGLLGSGAGSYLGFYESGQVWENLGRREMRPGLLIGSQLEKKIDIKSGMFTRTSATFQIKDDAQGTVARLFASKGKGGNRLTQHLSAGQDDLTELSVEGEGAPIAAENLQISTEAIGPNGERRAYFPFPFRGFGYEYFYPVNQTDDFPRPPIVSEEPIDFTGRLVTVWRTYRDTRDTTSPEYQKWAQWADLDLQTDLVWVGKMRDTGTYRGDKIWSFTCDGIKSLLQKQCGALTPREWMQVTDTTISLGEDENYLALELRFYQASADASPAYEGTHFQSVSFTQTLPTSGTRADYIAAISTIIEEVSTGVTSDYGIEAFTDWYLQGFVLNENGFHIVRGPETSSESDVRGISIAEICFHNKVWRILGWEPEVQAYDGSQIGDEKLIHMSHMEAGRHLSNLSANSPGTEGCPGEGYLRAQMDTIPIGMHRAEAHAGAAGSDNGGAARHYVPMHAEGGKVLLLNAGTTFQVSGQNLFCPKDPLVTYLQSSSVEGTSCTNARYWVFKGKRAAITDEQIAAGDFEDIEATEFIQVGVVSHPNGTYVGEVGGSLDGNRFVLERWVDCRAFGENFDRLKTTEEWTAIAGDGKYKIECVPLNALSYYRNTGSTPQLELVWLTLRSLLVSTGTVGGWSSGVADGVEPTFTQGDNGTIGDERFWGGDVLSSDMGLGIPEQLVMSIDEIEQAFAEIPDGEDAYNGFMRGRYAYRGAFDSYKTIESIIRTRGLTMTWKDGKIGVMYLGDFPPSEAEVVIDRDSIWGEIGNIRGNIPSQELRVTDPFDKIVLSYRTSVSSGKTVEEEEFVAKDEGSRRRLGDAEEPISDHGLAPVKWYVQAGKTPPPAWHAKFDRVWAVKKARWLAERHFAVQIKVQRRVGQRLGIGTKVLFTDPSIVLPDGTYGGTDVTGIVYGVTFVPGRPNSTEGEYYEVDLLIFAEQFDEKRYFMPIGEVVSISGTSVTLLEDMFGLGTGTPDAARFIRPERPSSLTGTLRVRLLEWDRVNYTLGSQIRNVVSRSGNVLTISSAFTGLNPYTKKWLVPAPYEDQDADNWAQELGIVTVTDDLEFGSGPTNGFPFRDE